MPNDIEEVTGNESVDESLQDISNSLFRTTKEMRSVLTVAANIVLWNTTSKDAFIPATIAKKGHHPLVRILIQQARDYESLAKLQEESELEPIEVRVSLMKAKQKALADLRDTSLRIQSIGLESMKAANGTLNQLMSLKQAWAMHKEKLGKDLKDASDDDLERLVGPASPEVAAGPRRLESFVEAP